MSVHSPHAGRFDHHNACCYIKYPVKGMNDLSLRQVLPVGLATIQSLPEASGEPLASG